MPTLLAINNYYYYRGGAETIFLEQEKLFDELEIEFGAQHSISFTNGLRTPPGVAVRG
jgi:hypothetical protein